MQSQATEKTTSKIINLIGFSRAGKDTFGKFFIEKGFKRLAFGDDMKEEFSKTFDVPLEYLHDDEKKEAYRKDMISFGESKRKYNPYFWVQKVFHIGFDYNSNYVVTDCRRIPEIMFLQWLEHNRKIKVQNVMVHKPVIDNDVETHKTIIYALEKGLVDNHVYNYSDLDFLKKQFDKIY